MSNHDALDQGKIKHFLSFENDITTPVERIEILEPVGFDGVDFEVKQDAKRYGRDVLFAGGNGEFTFHPLPKLRGLDHQFEKLLATDAQYGFESLVKYILNYDGIDYVIGELDFGGSETDQIKYFKSKVIQDTLEATIKRNIKTNVNVLSDRKVNGGIIAPLIPEKLLVNATPLKVVSEWSQPEEYTIGHVQNRNSYFCITPLIDKRGLDDTYQIPLTDFLNNTSFPNDSDADFVNVFELLNATNNLSNVTFSISNLTYDTRTPEESGFGLNFYYYIGETYNPVEAVRVALPNAATDYAIDIPMGAIQRNESLWGFFHVFRENSAGTQNGTYTSCTWQAVATSTAIDSVTKSIRLIDLMKQMVKSISDAPVDAPEFEEGGPLYDQFLILGNQLRNIDIDSFDISMDDILDGIKEFDADYEVQADGTVYFGTRDTFYQDIEMDRFNIKPNNEFKKTYNPRFELNTFNFKYEKYEKGQNDALENSREGIHTEAQYNLPNRRTSNTKSLSLPWIRDPFMIEKIRRQGLEVTDDTSQENDDDKVIVEVKKITAPITNTEGFQANHLISNTSVLEIINDGSFNWSIIGISPNDIITIAGENAGDYLVGSLGESSIQLTPVAPTPNPTFTGITYSTITYNITSTDLVVATDQDFQEIVGTTDTRGFANMSYSIARNIRNFFGTYLRTACKYHPNGGINLTLFKYNREFRSLRNDDSVFIFEGLSIVPITLPEAILDNRLTNVEVICDFPRLWKLIGAIRKDRGYVTLVDNKNREYKTYIQELAYNWTKNLLTIVGEDKE